jgi:Protein of unknown function (DUF2808)
MARLFWGRILTAVAVSGCLTALPVAPSRAEFTLFSGVENKDQLSYSLDFGNRSTTDRYRFRLPGTRLPLGAAQIEIVYFENEDYQGIFDPNNIEVNVGGKSILVSKANWDKEKRTVEITFKERLKTKQDIEIVLNNVKNPDRGGIYRFDCRVKSSVEFPLPRYAGTWIVGID